MRALRLFVLGLTSLAEFVTLFGCAEPRTVQLSVAAEVAEASRRYRKEYVLAPGDSIEIVVLKHPEVSRVCTIRPDGYISLPIVDDVEAGGLTPMELKGRLTEFFSKRLQKPEVTVIANQTRPPSAYIVGEVKAPRALLLRDTPTAAEAVAQAGGFTNWAGERSVMIIRFNDDGRLTATMIDMQELKGQVAPYMALRAVPLKPDDVIFVPKTRIAQVSQFIDQNINVILGGVNSVLTTYNQIRLTELLERELEE